MIALERFVENRRVQVIAGSLGLLSICVSAGVALGSRPVPASNRAVVERQSARASHSVPVIQALPIGEPMRPSRAVISAGSVETSRRTARR